MSIAFDVLALWLCGCSILTVIVCGADKRRARTGKWRISEKTLWILSLVGGAVGMLLGRRLFRHKTKHPSFVWGVPFLAILQVGLLVFVYIQATTR